MSYDIDDLISSLKTGKITGSAENLLAELIEKKSVYQNALAQPRTLYIVIDSYIRDFDKHKESGFNMFGATVEIFDGETKVDTVLRYLEGIDRAVLKNDYPLDELIANIKSDENFKERLSKEKYVSLPGGELSVNEDIPLDSFNVKLILK